MTSSRGFHSHVEILNLKPSTKQPGLQLNPWLNHVDPSFSLTGHHNRLAGTQKGTPAIPRSLIPTSPDTSFLVTSGLTSDLPDNDISYIYISISNRGISTVWAARMIASGRRIGLRFVTWTQIMAPFRQLELIGRKRFVIPSVKIFALVVQNEVALYH